MPFCFTKAKYHALIRISFFDTIEREKFSKNPADRP